MKVVHMGDIIYSFINNTWGAYGFSATCFIPPVSFLLLKKKWEGGRPLKGIPKPEGLQSVPLQISPYTHLHVGTVIITSTGIVSISF